MRNPNLPLHKVKLSMVHRQHASKHNINVHLIPRYLLTSVDDQEEVPGELGLVVKGDHFEERSLQNGNTWLPCTPIRRTLPPV